MIVGTAILVFFTGMIAGVGATCLMQARSMVTKLQIISRLWSHITDLRLLYYGKSKKNIEEIEREIDITEMYCRPYADADDME